jgi:hypothetical protein
MRELDGAWNYQSFVAMPAIVDRTNPPPAPPAVKRPALIAAPWTPPSIMTFSTDSSGAISGKAQLGPLEFFIKGTKTPAVEGVPEGIELTVEVPMTKSVYQLLAYFLKDSEHIVGTVVSINNDLGFQPNGTSAPFVLYPVRP